MNFEDSWRPIPAENVKNEGEQERMMDANQRRERERERETGRKEGRKENESMNRNPMESNCIQCQGRCEADDCDKSLCRFACP